MTILTVLHAIRRRWYVLVAGLLLTAVLCGLAYQRTAPVFQRSASELLVPGSQTVPDGGNPFLYLGGLGQASDVLVRALGAADLQGPIQNEYPEITVDVSRDVSTSGPIVLITAEGENDDDVAAVFQRMLDAAPTTLKALQTQAGVPTPARISLLPVTVDAKSTASQKGRLQVAGLIGAAGLAGSVLLVALVDGLALGAARRRRQSAVVPVRSRPLVHVGRRFRGSSAGYGPR